MRLESISFGSIFITLSSNKINCIPDPIMIVIKNAIKMVRFECFID